MTWCYTDRWSARPGEAVVLHASSAHGPCQLEVARIGAERRIALSERIDLGEHPRPERPDRDGCGWPAAYEIRVGRDWPSGYYLITLTDSEGGVAHHFLVVKPAQPSAKAALVVATNTLAAYNWWGGASAYAHVESLMARKANLATAMAGALGVLSTQRPIAPLLVAAPEDIPRLVNLRKRGFSERPWAAAEAPTWARTHRQSPYDGAAGFLTKWEHHFVR